MLDFEQLLTSPILWWSVMASTLIFVGSLIAIPWVVVRLPADYFDHRRRQAARPQPDARLAYHVYLVLKNCAGMVFLIAGIGMLVLPGQGLLTILIGLSLINFPGKYRLERYLVSRPFILRSLNWLRRRAGVPPFEVRYFEST